MYIVSSKYYEIEQEFDSLANALRTYKNELLEETYDLELKRKDEKEFTEEENLIIGSFFNC